VTPQRTASNPPKAPIIANQSFNSISSIVYLNYKNTHLKDIPIRLHHRCQSPEIHCHDMTIKKEPATEFNPQQALGLTHLQR
jgi:hypothetical protein